METARARELRLYAKKRIRLLNFLAACASIDLSRRRCECENPRAGAGWLQLAGCACMQRVCVHQLAHAAGCLARAHCASI